MTPLSLTRRSVIRSALLGVGAVACPTLLSACTGESSTPKKPKGVDGAARVELGKETSGILYPEEYVGPRASVKDPFHDGSKTFKVAVKQSAEVIGDWNTNEFSKLLEKRTGLKVEYQAVLNSDDDLSKVNALLASGDLPDAFLGVPFTNDQISLYGSQGVFVALDDYIETYAPETRRLFEDYPDWGPATTALDGRKYQLKGPNDCYHCRISPSRAFINQNYLEKVGAAMPETTDDLRKVLKLFKDKDPSGTGKMIPFGAGVSQDIDRYIMNAFLYNPGGDQNGGWLRLDNGLVDFVATKPEWREGLRYLRGLYDDGTLEKNAFTMTDEEVVRAGNQGRFGFIRSYYWGFFADIDYREGALWKDYVSIPPLKGPGGVQFANWDYRTGTGRPLVITSSCESPELLVQWADHQLELETMLAAAAGTKESNWWYAKEGELGINGKQAVWKRKQWPPPAGTSWDVFANMYNSNDLRLGQYSDPKNPDLEKDLYEATTVYEPFAQPREFQLPDLIFDEASAAQKADTAVAVEAHVKQSMAKFAVGELDVNDDGDWKAYVDRFEAMGLPSYLDLYQQTYEARPKQ